MERYTKGGAFKERSNGNIPYAEIVSFVSNVEDLCEQYQFNSFEELKNWVDWTHKKSMENYSDSRIRKKICNEIIEKIYAMAFNTNKEEIAKFSLELVDYIINVVRKG